MPYPIKTHFSTRNFFKLNYLFYKFEKLNLKTETLPKRFSNKHLNPLYLNQITLPVTQLKFLTNLSSISPVPAIYHCSSFST